MGIIEVVLEEEKEEARIEGKAEGERKARENMVINGYKKGLAISLLSDISGLTVAEIGVVLKKEGLL